MAQQEGGWPLGLQPLNARASLIRNTDSYGSVSFNTLLSGSPTSSATDSSSDLDTESTGSFFHDRRITLGNLIGISSILDLSSRSLRGRRQDTIRGRKSRNKGRTWFSLCARVRVIERDSGSSAPSLGHFLEVERRATTNACRGSRTPVTYELDGLPEASQSVQEANSLFADGRIAPPPRSADDGDLCRASGSGMIPLRFPCLRGATAA